MRRRFRPFRVLEFRVARSAAVRLTQLPRIVAPLAKVLSLDVADVQEAVASHAEIHKRRLNARLQVNNPALVNIPHEIVLTRALQIKFFKQAILNDRDAAFFRLRDVDQHFLFHVFD
jgi:hypothetical protein